MRWFLWTYPLHSPCCPRIPSYPLIWNQAPKRVLQGTTPCVMAPVLYGIGVWDRFLRHGGQRTATPEKKVKVIGLNDDTVDTHEGCVEHMCDITTTLVRQLLSMFQYNGLASTYMHGQVVPYLRWPCW